MIFSLLSVDNVVVLEYKPWNDWPSKNNFFIEEKNFLISILSNWNKKLQLIKATRHSDTFPTLTCMSFTSGVCEQCRPLTFFSEILFHRTAVKPQKRIFFYKTYRWLWWKGSWDPNVQNFGVIERKLFFMSGTPWIWLLLLSQILCVLVIACYNNK